MRSSGRDIAIWQRMSKLKRSVREPAGREMREAGFPPPKHYEALCVLSHAAKGRMPMAALEAEMSIPQYATYRIVAHLVSNLQRVLMAVEPQRLGTLYLHPTYASP